MTDMTPVPQAPSDNFLSVAEILELNGKIRENKAAQLRGEPPPHVVTREQIQMAVAGLRRQRGTMNFAEKTGEGKTKTKSGGKAKIELLDLDGL